MDANIAKIGQGCSHCEVGIPITHITSPGRDLHLCLECTMLWFPGKDTEWWESRHAPYADHERAALPYVDGGAENPGVRVPGLSPA